MPKKDLGIISCYSCPDKSRCEAYWLIMDLTATRDVCPLLPEMEKCVIDQVYLPHVRQYAENDIIVKEEES